MVPDIDLIQRLAECGLDESECVATKKKLSRRLVHGNETPRDSLAIAAPMPREAPVTMTSSARLDNRHALTRWEWPKSLFQKWRTPTIEGTTDIGQVEPTRHYDLPIYNAVT